MVYLGVVCDWSQSSHVTTMTDNNNRNVMCTRVYKCSIARQKDVDGSRRNMVIVVGATVRRWTGST